MKLLLLLPCLLVGNVFADAYGNVTPGLPAGSSSPVPSVTTPLQTHKANVDPQYPFGHLNYPMSYLAFAAIIKYEFPGHNDLDSLMLARTAVAAYPVYAPFVIFPDSK